MQKRIYAFMLLIMTVFILGACASTSEAVLNGINADANVNASVDTNTSTLSEQFTDSRIGKTLGEVMDLTEYMKVAITLDAKNDNERELKDVLPFEIYEIVDGKLINPCADDSDAKSVKADELKAMYGTLMIIKMDDADTYELVKRTKKDKYRVDERCKYVSLPDFMIVETDLTKEEVENMFDELGNLKEEHRHLLLGSAEVSNIGQTLNEYLSGQNKSPRYFIVNPYYSCLDELGTYNLEHLLKSNVVVVYFGENQIPFPGDEVIMIPTFFEQNICEKTLEEVVETINGYKIGEITELPYGVESIVSSYAPSEEVETASILKVKRKLEDLIDMGPYRATIFMEGVANNLDYELINELPFEVYKNTERNGLCNTNDSGHYVHMIPLRAIVGKTGTVMVVKMDNVNTYDLLLRIPKEESGSSDYCYPGDLGNFRVLANNLTKEQVEKMVNTDETLKSEYHYLIEALADTSLEKSFTVVGEWKIEKTGAVVIFKEDGTYESNLGDGFRYEEKVTSNLVAIEADGLGYGGLGMQDFVIVEEIGRYKLVCNDIVLIPASAN